MSRKRKSPKKRRTGPPARVTPHKPRKDSLRALMGTTGSADPARGRAYMEAFQRYEMWVLDGRPADQLDLAALPAEHRYLAERWPEGFEFFRHSMWAYAEQALGWNPWSTTLRSLIERGRRLDPSGFSSFFDELRAGWDRYVSQRRNVIHQIHENADTLSDREFYRRQLKIYTDTYEVDLPLWLVGVLADCYKKGRFQPGKYGGSRPAGTQGSLVGQVAQTAVGTPLGPLVERAYLAGLRNAINHNSYDIVLGPGDRGLVGVKGEDEEFWDGETVHDAWFESVHLLNASMSACAAADPEHSEPGDLRDCGLVSAYYYVEDDEPFAAVAQLWCFRDLDPRGAWLDAATFRLEDLGGQERAGFSNRAYLDGTKIGATDFGDALRRRGWLRVRRFPVVPALGTGLPVWTNPGDNSTYEIVGPADTHDIPYVESEGFHADFHRTQPRRSSHDSS